MRDPYNYDDQTAVLDSGDYPIVADAKSPIAAPFALQALAQRPRVVKRRESFFEEAQNALSHRWIELLQFLPGAGVVVEIPSQNLS